MKLSLNLLFSIIFLVVISSIVEAQNTSTELSRIHKKMRSWHPSEMRSQGDMIAAVKQKARLSEKCELKLKTTTTRSNTNHYKYDQYYSTVPVFGAEYILHEKDNRIDFTNGHLLPQIDVNIVPSISEAEALQRAMESAKFDQYSWEVTNRVFSSRQSSKPTPELFVLDPAIPNFSGVYYLAWSIKLFNSDMTEGYQYFIDAQDGDELLKLPLVHDHSVPGEGETFYYGRQSIVIDSVGPDEYKLIDSTRGNGIVTLDGNGQVWTNDSKEWELRNWDKDQIAIDAHYCTSEFYDMMDHHFGWQGVDGKGSSMISKVHDGAYVNAYWNGETAVFGDGNCHQGPLTTLEIVAHEFMHGITSYTAGLIYSDESGGINESMSDVFGNALEYFVTPDKFDWDIGESILLSPYASSIRSMSDPHLKQNPKYYKGEYWVSQVHNMSSVGNHWFYTLVSGGMVTNEVGETYVIDSMPLEDALDLVYYTLRDYLHASSSYADYRSASIEVAEDLFWDKPERVQSIKSAWNYVGVKDTIIEVEEYLGLVVPFSSFKGEFCDYPDSQVDVQFSVENIGTQIYTPDMNGVLSIHDTMIQLTDTIGIGEERIYYVTLPIASGIFESYRFYLDIPGHEDYQNALVGFGNVYNSSSEFYNVSLTEVYQEDVNCSNTDIDISTKLITNSCSGFNGEEILISIYNHDQSFSTSWIETPLPGSTEININTSVPFESNMQYWMEAILPEDDSYPPDNILSLTSPALISSADLPYLEDYDATALEGGFSIFNTILARDPFVLDYNGFMERYSHNGDTALYTTGIYLGPQTDGFFPCQSPGEWTDHGLLQTEDICLDFSDLDGPVRISFNLTQFRGEYYAFPELAANTTWTALIVEGDNYYDELIVYDQLEDIEQKHTLTLPSNFYGTMKFVFYNRSAPEVNVPNTRLTADAQLIDDVTIDLLSSVNSSSNESSPFSLHPNPVMDLLTLEGQVSEIKQIACFDIHGKEQFKSKGSSGQLDLSSYGLSPGIYLLYITTKDGHVSAHKFIKI